MQHSRSGDNTVGYAVASVLGGVLLVAAGIAALAVWVSPTAAAAVGGAVGVIAGVALVVVGLVGVDVS